MENNEQKLCKDCRYFRVTEEYWHDHYLIPEHRCCTFFDRYNPKDVDPNGCCENYQKKDRRKSDGIVW